MGGGGWGGGQREGARRQGGEEAEAGRSTKSREEDLEGDRQRKRL